MPTQPDEPAAERDALSQTEEVGLVLSAPNSDKLPTEYEQFLDDLAAANRFKTFLLATGIDVPKEVIHGLADLSERFLNDDKVQPRYDSPSYGQF